MTTTKNTLKLFSILAILTILFSNVQPQPVQAQDRDDGARRRVSAQRGGDGLERQVNPASGKVNFIVPENGRVLPAKQALGQSIRPQDPGKALANRFGPEFGLTDPYQELAQVEKKQKPDGQVTVKFQQKYENVPVMGGELIVNTNGQGDLYSINGEISPDLSLSTQAGINAAQAKNAALQGMAEWYDKTPGDFVATDPELWIYDEGLLKASTRPAELTWRMEVTAKDNSMPVRELVLVNAQDGSVSLHFNQVDTAWGQTRQKDDVPPTPTPEPPQPTEPPVSTDVPDTIEPLMPVSEAPSAADLTGTWFVAPTGSDTNSCTDPGAPCGTINGAIGKAASDGLVKIASGTYTDPGSSVVTINKSITLSGGWDSLFSSQKGVTIVDGGGVRNGIYSNTSGIYVTVDHFVVQNSKGTNGGGIYVYGPRFTLINSSVINNTAETGAGIYFALNNYYGELTISNSTISENIANISGGGVYMADGTSFINYSTIAYNNTNGSGGGTVAASKATLYMLNTLIANNTAAINSPDCSGSMSAFYILVRNASGCGAASVNGNKINVDPLLNASLSGVLPQHALQAGSPAIDAGDTGDCPAYDQRGMPRPYGSTCDIGSYEYALGALTVVGGSNQSAKVNTFFASPLTVNVIDGSLNPVTGVSVTFTAPASGASGVFTDSRTNVTTTFTNQYGTAVSPLFTANDQSGNYSITATVGGIASTAAFALTNNRVLYVATTGSDSNSCLTSLLPCATINSTIGKAISGDTINIATGSYTGTGTQSVILINKNISLSGGWNSDFSAQNSRSTIDGQAVRRVMTIDGGFNVTVDHLVIQNGYDPVGPGIYNWNGTLTLNNSLINGNSGPDAYTRSGIFITANSTVILNNSTISNNGGSGLYINGSPTTVVLNNSSINNNTSFGIYGAGILTLNNTTLSGNQGGLYISGTATLNNSTISGNLADNGGGIYQSGGTITLKNTIVAGNTALISGPDCYGVIGSYGYNLIGDNSNCNIISATGDQIGTKTTPINPRLAPLQNYGGLTSIHALMTGSPAINAGNPGVPGSGGNTCLSTDQRGIARPWGTHCDIGAFEYRNNGVTPAHIIVYEGTPQFIAHGGTASTNLKVVVLDNDGDAVPGVAVTFTAPVSGASAIFSTTGTNSAPVVADTDGFAIAPSFSVNNLGGSYLIQATVSGVADSADFQITNIGQIETYTANNTSVLPGTFLCDQTNPGCTTNSNPHADAAHKYAIGMYSFLGTKFNRDSIDNTGMVITSTVQYCYPGVSCPYNNANWTGTQMVYGSVYGYPLADDVVGHELMHGVTQYESDLFYYYQSGAINESLSDVFGEYYDQVGNVTAGDTEKWLLGEDVTGLGAFRSMSDPTSYGDPDRMGSSYYYTGADDNGGVHWNSGVNNKAVYLMVDGGSFNGRTITGLGWEKVGAVYYEANTNLLTSAADYSDLYFALQQACTNLVGQKDITSGDCAQVKNALDAVEMNRRQQLEDFGDPSFEYYSPNPYWEEYSSNFGSPLCTVADCGNSSGTAGPRTGSVWSWFGGTQASESAYVSQTVYFPDGYPSLKLKFYLWIGRANAGSDANDRFMVDVDGVTVFTANATQKNSYATYTPVIVDVGGFKTNALHQITFSSMTTGQFVNFNLDDISLNDDSLTISGNAGLAGAVLQYMDKGPQSVTADGSGNYSLVVRKGWTGTVTPYKTGYAFTPVNRSYGNVQSNHTGQNYTAQSCASCADTQVWIGPGAIPLASYNLQHQQSVLPRYSITGGPVRVKSINGAPVFTSQRAIYGNSFNELTGFPADQLTTDYWFTYYDDVNMATWLMIGNADPVQTAHVEVFLGNGNTPIKTYDLAHGESVLPKLGVVGGPLRVVSTNGVKIFTSQRAAYGNSFNELMGFPADQLTTDYWFTYYDDINMATWLMIGNADPVQSAHVEVYFGGESTPIRTFDLDHGESVLPKLGIVGGPVRVVSTNGVEIFTSQRAAYGNSFNELMGFPADQLTTDYWFTYYDDVNMATWLMIGNADPVQSAHVEVYLGNGNTPIKTYDLAHGESALPKLDVAGGPLRVVSTNGVEIFTSERVAYGSSFNELMGFPADQLTTDYWFTYYDDINMSTWLAIGKP
jgi:Zn-dependent metalloprotease